MNFAKFLRTHFLQNTFGRLLLIMYSRSVDIQKLSNFYTYVNISETFIELFFSMTHFCGRSCCCSSLVQFQSLLFLDKMYMTNDSLLTLQEKKHIIFELKNYYLNCKWLQSKCLAYNRVKNVYYVSYITKVIL